jgi:PAS domain S-box-containing protein
LAQSIGGGVGKNTQNEELGRIAELQAENERLRQALATMGRESEPADGETSFDAIANSIDQLIWSTRPDGFHDYFNRRWYEYTGMPVGSTDGEEWNGMFHPDDQERAWGVWRHSLATGEPYHIEYRLRHRSGEYRWVLGRARPIRDDAGAILRWYGTCTDIHDLKVAQEQLRENEERLRLVVDSATDHVIFTTDPNRIITSWSTGAANVFGYSAAQAIGRSADMLWIPEDRAARQPEREQETARSTGCANDERWHQRADGGRVFLNGSAHPLPPDAEGREQGFIKIARDETARRATEEALLDAEARFRFLDTLSKATQGENHPEAIMAAATRLLGEHLGVDICAYADVAPDGDSFTIRRDWTAPGVPSIVGFYSLNTFGEVAAAAQRAGVPLVVRDAVGELGAEQATTFTSIGIAATICLPLVKGGRLAAMMAVHSATPRNWVDSEVALVAEVVERCWAHVERVGAEAELREREIRLTELTDNIPTLCWWADASGYIYWYNRRWYEYTGTEPADMEGWGWRSVHDPDCLPGVMERWQASIATGEPFEMTFPLKGADGVFRPFLTRIVPFRDESGAIVRWFGTNTDIAEEKGLAAALQDSEARLRKVNAEQQAILSQLAEGVIVTDATGRIIFVNEAAKQLHGVEALDVEPSEYSETYHLYREDGSPHPFEELPLARAVMKGETVVDARWRIRRTDGTEVLAIGSARPISDGDAGRFGSVLTVRDDTRRFEAEQALRDESRTLETLNRTGAALAGELDLDKLVQMVTDAGVELTGAKFGAFFYNVEEGGELMMLYTLSGAQRSDFDAFGMPRATAIFSPTFAGEGPIRSDDILTDPRYGKNHPHKGMPEGHLPVRSYLAVPVTSRSGEVIGGLFFGHPEPGRFAERHERLVVGIAGQAAIGIDNARLFQAAQRELAERVRAEERLRELNETLEQRVADEVGRRSEAEEALRQMQKMETLGQLTGGVAHDFNNLLQIVTGNLEILQRNLPEDQVRLRRSAENAMRGAERAAVLTQRLLAFARRQPLEPRPINLNRLVGGMSELLHQTLGEAFEIETVLASGLWSVEADPNQLENAIINLAVNARDAMGEGGKLTIETANAHLDHAYAAQNTGVAAGQYVVICVSDTGSGMDEGTLERVFEPFFTTKDVGRGTGLGLSMVYGFVKQSGGHVKIYSEAGQGTSVKLYLPRLIGAVAEEEAPPEQLVPEGTREETILVCEDDDDVRTYSVEVLRELGYRVLEAHDGPSALRLLERQGGEVDLLFTDVVLPSGMMGDQLAEQARAIRPGLKVLFTTGYARNAIVHQGRLDPGVELITKPFAYADLAGRIRDLLDKS